MDLQEGVAVCNLKSVLLYNQLALKSCTSPARFGSAARCSPWSPTRFPTPSAVCACAWPKAATISTRWHHHCLVCATTDGQHTLHAQMTLILAPRNRPPAMSFTFNDITEELAALGKGRPIAARSHRGSTGADRQLQRAARREMQAVNPDMDIAAHRTFDEVVEIYSRKAPR